MNLRYIFLTGLNLCDTFPLEQGIKYRYIFSICYILNRRSILNPQNICSLCFRDIAGSIEIQNVTWGTMRLVPNNSSIDMWPVFPLLCKNLKDKIRDCFIIVANSFWIFISDIYNKIKIWKIKTKVKENIMKVIINYNKQKKRKLKQM